MELDGRDVTVDEVAVLGLCNYGHFTSMRVEDMRVRGLELHLERLAHDSLEVFGVALDVDRVRHLARRMAARVGATAVIRVTVFDPDMELGRPSEATSPRILVTTRPAASGDLPPISLGTARYGRELAKVKHLGLFGALHRRRTAQLDGFDDVLLIDSASFVCEVATSNIAFLTDGTVVWPQADWLDGVTMRLVQQLMRAADIAFRVEPVTVDRMGDMDAAFITNAAVGLRAVSKIDHRSYADPGSLLTLLRKEYAAMPGDAL